MILLRKKSSNSSVEILNKNLDSDFNKENSWMNKIKKTYKNNINKIGGTMFLNYLEKHEMQEAFLKMAVIVAIANNKPENTKLSKERSNDLTTNLFTSTSMTDIVADAFKRFNMYSIPSSNREESLFDFCECNTWKANDAEKELITKFRRELEFEEDEVSVDDFNKIIDELEEVFEGLSSLSEELRRKEIIMKLLDDAFLWSNITPSQKEKRVIMFNLLNVALADGNYSPMEKFAIENIAKKLGLNLDDINSLIEYLATYKKIEQEGIELICG